MVPDSLQDRQGTCKRLLYILRAKTVWATSGDSQTVCYSARQSLTPSKTVWESHTCAQTVFAPSQTVWESRAGTSMVLETVGHSLGSLMQVPGRSWHRRRLSGILLLVPRRSCILSGTVCESPAGTQTSFKRHRLSGSLLPVPRRSG
ncbi:hypothetical protein DPMN_094657 [Dreissena polymorpha]|uniref:Uncharacterized protein n=1 Tax=Dreissena polymorpha TaxID=45954 RepID=A0A9D4L5G2_DREPO|nr:hypothetical protein DPMN_094657 [Dreissena polymorpha]